ncbi:hypothetical protein R3I93_015086 [Phoxinus phoxinus]
MEAEDILCDSLFRWLENREGCAEELSKLAQELKDVHWRSNIAQSLPFICLGLASPIVLPRMPTASTEKDEKIGTSIQKLLRDLKVRCGEDLKVRCGEDLKVRCGEDLKVRCGEAPLGAHADELDCEVTSRLMWALSRRKDTPVPLDFLRGFNRATFFRHMTPGGLAPDEVSDLISKALGLVLFTEITSSRKVSAKEMVKNIELIGIKAEAGSEALGATGLGISLYDLIVKSEELLKGNRVTEARKVLRDSAGEILDGQRKLKEQLDAMQ